MHNRNLLMLIIMLTAADEKQMYIFNDSMQLLYAAAIL